MCFSKKLVSADPVWFIYDVPDLTYVVDVIFGRII